MTPAGAASVLGCDDHGWINLETLSEWMQKSRMQKSTDFYCNIGLVVLDNVSSFLEESTFQKFCDDFAKLAQKYEFKVNQIIEQ